MLEEQLGQTKFMPALNQFDEFNIAKAQIGFIGERRETRRAKRRIFLGRRRSRLHAAVAMRRRASRLHLQTPL